MILKIKIKYIAQILLVVNILTQYSCFREDDKIILPQTEGETILTRIGIGQKYENQIFFDLNSDQIVKSNPLTAWDIGFSCNDSTWDIVLNNSKSMLAANTFSSDFDGITDDEDLKYRFDSPAGIRDSLAFSGWYKLENNVPISNEYVFIVDRGKDENGKKEGKKKIIVSIFGKNSFIITYSDLDGSSIKTDTIEKNSALNNQCYSFDTGIVDIEPEKDKWSLLFTKYQTYYQTIEGNFLPYTVVGVLQNPFEVKVKKDTKTEFNEINISNTNNIYFTDSLDIIGFDWKYYNFDEDNYSIVDSFKYIILNNDQYYYKMRFLEFYDEQNRKGFPLMEFKRL